MEFPEIPGYKIKDRLGKGGMAEIFLAEQVNFGRLVALKIMAPHLVSDSTFVDRFMREARIVAQMNHPNFVPVYDVGQHEDYTYMSMEYLPAGDLKGLMRSGLTLSDGVRIIKEIASALHYAAGKHFIHRDIKPENVLLREDLTAVVCDFGIAKQTNASTQMTMVGTVIGTPHYMSPEQAQAGDLDGRSDLYSLGVILFEMLTGHVPYSGDSAVQTGIMHVTEPIPELPQDLAPFQEFIDIALAKSADDRYQTGEEMIYALEDLEEEEYDLIHAQSVTVMMTEEEMKKGGRRSTSRSKSGSRPGRGTGARGTGRSTGRSATRTRTGRSGTRIGADGVRKRVVRPAAAGSTTKTGLSSTRNRVMAISVAATLGVGATGWWYMSGSSPQRSTTSFTPSTISSVTSGNFATKAEELREKAEEALDDGRLYGVGEDNAQSYLTTLLVLAPDDSGGKAGITRLFGMYLTQASEAIEVGDFNAATTTLNQASQISFYIEEPALVEQQGDMRRMLIEAQQQAIIAADRDQQIKTLLADAESLLADGKLTTPADGNAYDKYQDVLSLAPDNEVASKGIEDIAGNFLGQAREQLKDGQLGRARSFVAAAVAIYPQHSELADVRTAVMAEEERLQDEVVAQQQQQNAAQEDERTRRAEERKARAKKVESLLAGAAIDIKADRLSSPENNNAIDKYNQVLDLDPANVDALNGLEDVAKRYIEVARGLIKEGNLRQAERNLVRAKILSPSSPEYTAAQSELIAVRDRAMKQEAAEAAQKERIADLLKGAELAVSKGNIYLPRGSNALENLRQVLELDGDNKPALTLRSELNGKIQSAAAADIKARRFDDAKLAIDALVSNNASDRDVGSLRKELSAEQDAVANEVAAAEKREKDARDKRERERLAKAQAAEDEANRAMSQRERDADARQKAKQEQQKAVAQASEAEKLLAQASAMGGPGRVTSVNYRKLAELYGKVLKLEPQNSAASRGLTQVSDYTARQAGFAVNGRDYRSATMYIDYLAKIAPKSPQLPKLREDLADSQRRQEQAVEILAAAEALIALPYKKPGMFGNNTKPRKNLMTAYGKIESARQVDARSPSLAKSEQKLVKKYTDIINTHLEDEDPDEAQEFMDDLVKTKLAKPQVSVLQAQLESLNEDAEESGQVSVSSF